MQPVKLLGALVATALVTVGVGVAEPGHAPTPAAAASAAGVPVTGPSVLSSTQLANWYRATKRTPAIPVSIDELASYYIAEGLKTGVRGDLAFAQSIVETGYFGFVGSIVKPSNYNYAGMGACDSCNSGRQFPNARVGVRAQVQHLRNFSDPTSRAWMLPDPPVVEWYGRRSDGSLDPALAVTNFDRFFAKGAAPTWNQMGGPGKWASTPTYGDVVIATYNRMLTFNGQPATCPPDRLAFGGNAAAECPVGLRHAGRAIAGGAGGYYVLNGNGAVKAVGAPSYGSPSFGFDIARDIATMPDGQGYVVLDGFGGVHLYGSAANSPLRNARAPYFGFDVARSITLTGDGAGYFILDGWGGIHTGGTAQRPAGRYPYWSGWDIARSISVTPDGRGLVELDGFGGVWTFGTVPMVGTTYFGFDIARDIAVTADGQGYALLDGFGAIHRFGNAPAKPEIGYAFFDRWRSLTIRDGHYNVVRNDGYSV